MDQPMTKQYMIAAKLIFIIALILGAIFLFRQLSNSGILVNRNHTAVITEIKKLNKLETSVFTIEKIIDARTPGSDFQRFLFGDKILLIAHGRAVAGVDMSKLTEEQISISGQSITITLPPTEIFNSSLDENRTQVYDRTQGILTKGNMDLETTARRAAESEIQKAACEGGILTSAAESAKQQLTALLQSLNFTRVDVRASAGQCTN
jgi:hypothetical protein